MSLVAFTFKYKYKLFLVSTFNNLLFGKERARKRDMGTRWDFEKQKNIGERTNEDKYIPQVTTKVIPVFLINEDIDAVKYDDIIHIPFLSVKHEEI